jgi:protein-S-isoprenylcysteine O-methyltransferase Ste14
MINQKMTFEHQYVRSYESKAGYVGAAVLLALVIICYSIGSERLNLGFMVLNHEMMLFVIIGFTGISMASYDISARIGWYRRQGIAWSVPDPRPTGVLAWSAFIRFLTTGALLSTAWFIVNSHYYFQDSSFNFTRLFYDYLLTSYLLLGYPVYFITLRKLGRKSFDFNDYALLTLLGLKGFWIWCTGIMYRWPMAVIRGRRIVKSRRVRKIYLVHLVNFFFLTLMVSFFFNEYSAFSTSLSKLTLSIVDEERFFYKYHHTYLTLYHLIFVIDVGIAIIAYATASRWLDNRTKSVDMTFYGWFVVLLCYPPMNAGFTDRFIGYGMPQTSQLITSELGLMFLMPLILFCYLIYVWATLALGFRFSNLTHRGLISSGPYRYFRHPAYTMKNIAWWLDNTHVLTNFWAALSLLIWNWIYVLRGITEERHLIRDPEYQRYQQAVLGRFMPCWSKRR